MSTLYIDADSVPRNLRAIILRAAVRRNIRTTFVADRSLPDVEKAREEHTASLRKVLKEGGETDKAVIRAARSWITMVVVPTADNGADDWIVDNASSEDGAVTHDIPLAARLVEKGVYVIDDRGNRMEKDTIRERLSIRDVNMQLRSWGIFDEKSRPMGPRETALFSNELDKLLVRIAEK